MKATTEATTPEALEVPEHPAGPDAAWAHVMILGDQAIFADTRTELVEELIPGYADLPDSDEGNAEALGLRYEKAVAVATQLQTGICVAAAENGDFDPTELVKTPEGDETLQALMVERTIPFEPSPGSPLASEDGGATEWDHTLPLVLISTDYAPYTERPRPTGFIVWIDPSDERALLESIAATGLIAVFHQDPDSEESDDALDAAEQHNLAAE